MPLEFVQPSNFAFFLHAVSPVYINLAALGTKISGFYLQLRSNFGPNLVVDFILYLNVDLLLLLNVVCPVLHLEMLFHS